MNRILALWRLMRRGEEVADAATWKNRTIATNGVVAFLVALVAAARSFGIDIEVSDADLSAIAAGVVVLVGLGNTIMYILTSRKIGLPPEPPATDEHSPY